MMRFLPGGCGLLALAFLANAAVVQAQPPAAAPLTVETAVAWALEHNPDLAVARKNRGIADAGIVIARTYPFNPLWQGFVMAANGPRSYGISNRVFNEHTFRLDLELRGQGKIRRGGAQATLSRTEWEIATQEQIVAIRTVRAVQTFVYRQEKVRLLEEAVQFQEQALEKVQRLVGQGQLRAADLILARTDVMEARTQLGPGRALLVAAGNELRRVLGVEGDIPFVQGTLPRVVPEADGLDKLAHERRPDLRALEMVVAEADQRVRLEIANRYGNPSVGPATEVNEASIAFVGLWMVYQLPVLNTRRGEILQRQAERDRALTDVRRLETQIGQDVQAARDRLAESRKWVAAFTQEALPALEKAVQTIDRLFLQGEPGADATRMIEAHRRLFRARDSQLDAQWELSMARADLAAAVGDFTLALDGCGVPVEPVERPSFLAPTVRPE